MDRETKIELTLLVCILIVGWLPQIIDVDIEVLIPIWIAIVIISFKNPELSIHGKIPPCLYITREIDLSCHKTKEGMSVEYLKRVMQKTLYIRDIQCTGNKVTARSLVNIHTKEDEPDCSAEIVGNKLIISGPRSFCKALTIRLIGRLRASIVMEE